MHNPVIPPVLAATLLFCALAAPALAQVTTSQSALDALGPSGGGGRKPTAHHAAAPAHPHPHAAAHPGRSAAAPRAAARGAKRPAGAAGNAPSPTIPPRAPPPPVFTAPVINVPLHPPPPPPPVPVVMTAVGTTTPIDGGVRIGFGAGSSDLNPATMQALHDFAAELRARPEQRAILDAAAAGSADDPSTPRRLALSRGLAARAVLINDGIASTRIYVRMDPRAAAGNDHVDLLRQSNPGGEPSPIPGMQPAQPTPTAPPAPAAASPPPAAPGHAPP